MKVPLKHPNPDIENFKEIILKRKPPERVPFIEIHIDKEIIEYLAQHKLGIKWIEPLPEDREIQRVCLKNYIKCWYHLGYDYVKLGKEFRFSGSLSFSSMTRKGKDTAILPRKERQWVEESKGVISSWEDFEKYPWPSLERLDLWPYEYVSKNLPEGMGIFVSPGLGIFEVGLNELFGYENLCYLLYDDPELVKAVFDRVGELIYGYYKKIVGLEKLAGFFQGDDMGFKTSTLIAPESLREYILPWHKKIAKLAHDYGVLYLFHGCGNLEPIMEDLIEDVKIDAKHSFEDEIMPVTHFKKKYGDRVAVLGGVDVDKLCRMEEKQLRQYVSNILDECMQDGGYALGSGNSIANYIPVKNFLVMLDEGIKWAEQNL